MNEQPFKVGDRVRVRAFMISRCGETGKVIEIAKYNRYPCAVQFDEDGSIDGFRADQIELIAVAEPSPIELRFKVGDILLIKYPSSRFNGKVGKVVKVWGDVGSAKYMLDCDEFGIAVFEDTRHLELVESAPAEPSSIEHTLTHEWCAPVALARLTWSDDNDGLPVLELDDLAMTREQLVALRDMLTAALEVMT